VHELSVAGAIVNTATKHAAGRRVTVVTVRIGRLRQVVPDTLDFYWDIVCRDSACEGSRLEQVLVPARLRCTPCASEWEPEWALFRCVTCGGSDVTVVGGEELEVESIEVEEDALCTESK
jgi:hydrogenase nickel incorporation protein HypA/HybF